MSAGARHAGSVIGPVAVTGATGHLGSVLVPRLARLIEGRHGDPAPDRSPVEAVRAVVRTGSVSPALDVAGVRRVEADLLDPVSLADAFEGADAVIHAAGRVVFSSGDADELHRVNVRGTQSVVAAALACGVRRLVVVGSIEAFPLESDHYPVTEARGIDPRRTVMEYGRTKALAIQAALAAGDAGLKDSGDAGGISRDGFGGDRGGGTPGDDRAPPPGRGDPLDVVVCCPTAFIGPPDYRRSPLGAFVADYLARRLPAYVDGGFDFVDVRDVADGVIAALERGTPGSVYLLGGHYLTIPELIELLEEESGVPRPPLRLPLRLVLPLAPAIEAYYSVTKRAPRFTRNSLRLLSLGVSVDSSRARDELGYTRRPVRETIADTVAWFRGRAE